MKKSNRSGIFLVSVGQYVGVPADRTEKFFVCMSVASSSPLDVINLEPQSVCLLLKSPPTMKHEPRVWKKESKWVTFRLCLGGQ